MSARLGAAAVALLVACGGKAVVDDPLGAGGTGQGGATTSGPGSTTSGPGSTTSGPGSTTSGPGSTTSGPSTVTSTSVTTGPDPGCGTDEECCAIACAHVTSLPCWDGGDCDCDVSRDPCGAAVADLIRCTANNVPSSFTCFDGEPGFSCAVCGTELMQMAGACGGAPDCH